jgi:aminoglycoside phosphotransferase (APT) family kinase protein
VTGALAADASLPARDVVLDARAIAPRLSRLLGARGPLPIERYSQSRVNYSVGRSLRVVHRLQVGTRQAVVASRTFSAGRSGAAYERARAAARPAGPLRPIAHDPELETVFFAFPNDRKIATLAAIGGETDTVASVLGRAVRRQVLVAYAAEQSATAACLCGDPERVVAYAKVYAEPEEAQFGATVHARIAGWLAGEAGVRVPSPLAYSPGDRLVVIAPVDGRRIDALGDGELLHAVGRLGAALATLHARARVDGLPRFERLGGERQLHAAELIGRVRPDLAVAAGRLAASLLEAEPPADGPPVCLHGDVHLKNGVLSEGGVALIDFDQAAAGPAAADVGSALAGLRLRGRLSGDPAAGERLSQAFLSGYREVRELPGAEVLRWHVAAALLGERALRAVRRVRPDALAQLPVLIEDARSVLMGAAT